MTSPRLSATLLAGIARHRQRVRLELALQGCAIAGELSLSYVLDAAATEEVERRSHQRKPQRW